MKKRTEKIIATLLKDEREVRHQFHQQTLMNGNILTFYAGGDITYQHPGGMEFELGNVEKGEIDDLVRKLLQYIPLIEGI